MTLRQALAKKLREWLSELPPHRVPDAAIAEHLAEHLAFHLDPETVRQGGRVGTMNRVDAARLLESAEVAASRALMTAIRRRRHCGDLTCALANLHDCDCYGEWTALREPIKAAILGAQ